MHTNENVFRSITGFHVDNKPGDPMHGIAYWEGMDSVEIRKHIEWHASDCGPNGHKMIDRELVLRHIRAVATCRETPTSAIEQIRVDSIW